MPVSFKTLAALACKSADDVLDGCAWIAQFNELPPARAKLYRCISNIVQLNEEMGGSEPYLSSLNLMFGIDLVQQAQQLVSGKQQYLGLNNLGANMEGSQMHQQLLAAYGKVWKR